MIYLFLFFDISAYLHPIHFWPLDYSTWVREIIEDNNPKVQGRNSLLVAGKGNGYLEFSPLKSSAVLGSFNYKCLSDPKNCNEHLTTSFWVRLDSLQYVSSKEKFRFLGTEFGSIKKEVGLEIFCITEGSKFIISELRSIVVEKSTFSSIY